MILEPGQILERYEVEVFLDDGGMAEVYRVRHTLLGGRHALKVLRPELARTDEVRSRFLAEGRIQARIHHPNLVRVTDVVSLPGVAGLVMELVEGPTLAEHLDGRLRPDGSFEALSPAEIAALMLPILDGVATAHAHGVIHRDLKPENIKLAVDRLGRLTPKILDFGIAKVKEQAGLFGALAHQTRTGAWLGTPHYMSPEQIRAPDQVDARTDLFALGAILYELATGKMAFPGLPTQTFDIQRRIVDGVYTRPELAFAQISPAVAACITRALATDPAARFPDCAAFAEAVAAWGRAPAPAPKPAAAVATHPPAVEARRVAPTPPPARASKGSSVLLWLSLVAVVVLGAAFFLGLGAWRSYEAAELARADALARGAMARLQEIKQSPKANQDALALRAAWDLAGEAVAVRPTPAALGARALAGVWRIRGHYDEVDPSASTAQEVEVATVAAAESGGVEGELARAMLLGNRCGWMKPAEPQRPSVCAEATTRFDEAERLLRGDPRGWLRFELWWTEALYHNRLALAAWAASNPDAAQAQWQLTLDICTSGEADLAAAPVNDVELAQECLAAAGGAGRLDAFQRWAGFLRARAERSGKLDRDTVAHIYRSAWPDCGDFELRRVRGHWLPNPKPAQPAEIYCASAGLVALGCPVDLHGPGTAAALVDNNLPWAELLAVTPQGECYLGG